MPVTPKTRSVKLTVKKPVGLDQLREIGQQAKKKHFRAHNTTTAYARAVRKAQAWLAEHVSAPQHPGSTDNTPELASAFDTIPNAALPEALSLYLVHRCLDGNCGLSVAEQERAGMKDWWSNG